SFQLIGTIPLAQEADPARQPGRVRAAPEDLVIEGLNNITAVLLTGFDEVNELRPCEALVELLGPGCQACGIDGALEQIEIDLTHVKLGLRRAARAAVGEAVVGRNGREAVTE